MVLPVPKHLTTNVDSEYIKPDASYDASSVTFAFTDGVGLDVSAPAVAFWLSWEETKGLAKWLSEQGI